MISKKIVDTLHTLAVTSVTPENYSSPLSYLNWFLTEANNLFLPEEEIFYSNIQFQTFENVTNQYFLNGRLISIPSIFNVKKLNDQELLKHQLEIISFLTAMGIFSKEMGIATKFFQSVFRDKLIMETYKKDKNDKHDFLRYDDRNNKICVSIPDFYEEKILKKYFMKYSSELKLSKSIDLKYGHIILDGLGIEKALHAAYKSSLINDYSYEVNNYLNRKETLNEINKFRNSFDGFSSELRNRFNKNEVMIFVKSAMLHSWLKSVKYSYQVGLTKFGSDNKPGASGVFLVNSDKPISIDKLNMMHIALNIAFNALYDIQGWVNEPETFKYQKSSKKRIIKEKSILEEKKFVFDSPYMKTLNDELEKISNFDVPVLLTGETGVGKDVIARQIHLRSNRKTNPFTLISLKNIPESLIESELFGYEKGSFTDASQKHIGKLEQANNGTVYFPEISELDNNIQLKLLEFLQYGTIQTIGSKGIRKNKLNLRLIFASNENPELLIEHEKIRKDFYYRIKILTIDIPPLRERKEDIVELVKYFVDLHSVALTGKKYRITEEALNCLKEFKWLGNVRELENSIIKAIIEGTTGVLEIDNFKGLKNLMNKKSLIDQFVSFKKAELNFKREYFKDLLDKTNGNISEAAQLSGVTRQTLHRIIKELKL